MLLNKMHYYVHLFQYNFYLNMIGRQSHLARSVVLKLTGSTVITHDVPTGTAYCLVGFNWIIDFLN